MKINFALILAVAITFASCQKDKVDYQKLSEDAALSQSLSSDVFKTVDNEAKSGGDEDLTGKKESIRQSNATCATIHLLTTNGNFPDTLIIDFGSTGCTDFYGINRKGKLICAFTGPYKAQGTIVTVSTENYIVNGYKVEGVKTITNKGRNTNGKMYFTVVDANGKITKPDGKVVTWTSNYTSTWTKGEDTDFWQVGISGICDDEYAMEGAISGTGSAGDTYSYQSTSPIIKNVCCYYIQQGTLDVYVNGKKVAAVDYGDGTCDSKMVVTYNNKDYVVYM